MRYMIVHIGPTYKTRSYLQSYTYRTEVLRIEAASWHVDVKEAITFKFFAKAWRVAELLERRFDHFKGCLVIEQAPSASNPIEDYDRAMRGI